MERAPVISPDSVPRRRLDAKVRNIGGTIVVAGSEQALELSDTARLLWLTMDGTRSVRELADRLVETHHADLDQAIGDVIELLHSLAGAGVVTVRP